MYQQPGPQHYRQPSQLSQPPAKRPRGNPIITRYPPPPGYKPPPQPQPPFVQQHGWQQPPPAFVPNAQTYGHQQPSHASYGQPSFQPPQHSRFNPPAYYGQIPHPSSMSTWQSPVIGPHSAPPQTWQAQQNGFGPPPDMRRHNSLPQPPTGSVLDGNGDPLPPPDLTSDTGGLEENFDAECYFLRHPEQINPHLSLGEIVWYPPRSSDHALPATFREAEVNEIAQRQPRSSESHSSSDYCIQTANPSKCDEEKMLISVRQTEGWNAMKQDLIFTEFSLVCSRIVTLSELFDKYRVQIDHAWEEADRSSPTPELSRDSTPARDQHEREGSMDLDERIDSVISEAEAKTTHSGVLDDLERALQGDCRNSRSRDGRSTTPAEHFGKHSRTSSMASQPAPRFARPKPLPPVRDPKQEDILASLGVTGSPKLVYQTPGPAFGPPPPTKPGDNHSRASSVSSARSGLSSHAPAFKPQTALFHGDLEPDNDATPRPKLKRNDSTRKRSYADATAGASDGSAEEDDEATPRQKRKHAKVGGH